MLVILKRPRATRSGDLKLLTRLLPELYSTQFNYHYLSEILRSRMAIAVGITLLGSSAKKCSSSTVTPVKVLTQTSTIKHSNKFNEQIGNYI